MGEQKSAPGRIRTADHLVRSQVLYPAELRAPARSLTLREQLGNLGRRQFIASDAARERPTSKADGCPHWFQNAHPPLPRLEGALAQTARQSPLADQKTKNPLPPRGSLSPAKQAR